MDNCPTCTHPASAHDVKLSAAGNVACVSCPDGTCYRMPAGRGQADELESVAADLSRLDEAIAEQVAERIAGKIAARLRDEHVIPAEIPAWMGQQIREGNGGRAMWWHYPLPLAGSNNIGCRWTLLPNGGLHLELTDGTGAQFWQGTLHPAEGGTRG